MLDAENVATLAPVVRVLTPIERRRARVAKLAKQGWSQWAIAMIVGVGRSTVCEDLKALGTSAG